MIGHLAGDCTSTAPPLVATPAPSPNDWLTGPGRLLTSSRPLAGQASYQADATDARGLSAALPRLGAPVMSSVCWPGGWSWFEPARTVDTLPWHTVAW